MSSKGTRISETSQAEEQIGHESTYIRNTRVRLIEKEGRMVVAKGRGKGTGECHSSGTVSVIQDTRLGSRDLLYNVVPTVNNTGLCT